MDAMRNTFRKKLVGGFNEEDVISYIRGLGEQIDELERSERSLRDNVRTLTEKYEASQDEIRELREKLDNCRDDSAGKVNVKIDEIKGLLDGVREAVSDIGRLFDGEDEENGAV